MADDGIGIPELRTGQRIFERFYKVDRVARAREDADGLEPRGGSAGLGLAIVRHMAEAHGGSRGRRERGGHRLDLLDRDPVRLTGLIAVGCARNQPFCQHSPMAPARSRARATRA